MKTALLLLTLLSMTAVVSTTFRRYMSSCNHQSVVVNANGKFAFALYKKIGSYSSGQNMIFSPFSVSTALAMTYGGASGVTKSQMASALRFSGIPANCNVHKGFKSLINLIQNHNTVNTANRIYVDKSLDVTLFYGWLTSTYYLAPIQEEDIYHHPITVTNKINNWVKTQTNNQITNLLTPLDRDVKLVLVNAISFKDKWVKPFGLASNGPFHLSNSATAQVCKMSMSCGAPSLKYGSIPGVAAKIVELPYQAHQVSMYIIRPNWIQGLSSVENSLTLAKLNSAISAMTTRNVNIVLPKFTISKNMDLKDRLKSLGMNKLFTYSAQLSGIGSGAYQLYVEFVQQKAVIKVDLKGTEASAATAVGVCPAPGRRRRTTTVPFDVDRPFLFVLRENSSGSILFMGRVTHPHSSCSGSGGFFDRVFRPRPFTSLSHASRPVYSVRSG